MFRQEKSQVKAARVIWRNELKFAAKSAVKADSKNAFTASSPIGKVCVTDLVYRKRAVEIGHPAPAIKDYFSR